MRLQNYFNDSYIGIVDKNQESPQELKKDKKINNLLKELNNYLSLHTKKKDVKFGITYDYHSPTEVINDIDERKLEKLTRKWMKLSEEFDEIKENYKNSLQNL